MSRDSWPDLLAAHINENVRSIGAIRDREEQKVTKLIALIEELRRDLPMVPDRHDPVAAHLQWGTDATEVISALEELNSAGARQRPTP